MRTALLKGNPSQIIWITFGGKTFRASRRTAAHLFWTQAQLDKKHPGCRLYVIQPCFNIGVKASEGTHDKDKVLDVSIVGMDWFEAQRFLRAHGWAAWVREPPTFTWHIHMISLGGNTPVGIYVPGQVDDYYRHTFGLANQHNTDLDKSWFPGDEGKPPWPVGTPDQWRRDIDATIFDFAQWERELEDDMYEKEDRDRAKRIEAKLDRTITADQRTRAQLKALREKIATRAKGDDLDDVAADVDAILAELGDE